MPRLTDIKVHMCDILPSTRFGTMHKIEINNGDIYFIFSSAANNDLTFCKSSDGGISWSQPVLIFVGTAQEIAVWYDRWSGIAAGLIHIAYTEGGGSDTLYRTIDTESADALSTQTTIFAGASSANGAHLSIARARGGNVYCKTCIDAGVEGGFFRLPNANVPNGAWDAARTVDEALATNDKMLLLPGFAADNQDMLAIFWDHSANEISRKIYDDSANSWAETSIATSFTGLTAATAYPNFSAAVDLTNSRILLIAWNGTDTANADLQCWTVTESAITAKTDVVTNGTDDQGLCAVGLDLTTGYWYAFYGGKSDGSSTWQSAMPVMYKISTDAGATWGSELALTSAAILLPASTFVQLVSCPRFTYFRNFSPVHMYDANGTDVHARVTVPVEQPMARHELLGG